MKPMRALLAGFLLSVLGTIGVGLEVAHPVVLGPEPVVVWTEAHEGPPRLSFNGDHIDVSWARREEEGRLRWESAFPHDAPLGVWTVWVGDACYAFLRVPEEWAVLEVVAGPAPRVDVQGAEKLFSDQQGRWFTGPAGNWSLEAGFPTQEGSLRQELAMAPGERRQVVLAHVALALSTPVARPGSVFRLTATVISPVDLPALTPRLRLPPDWRAESVPCADCPPLGLEPVPAGHPTAIRWEVQVPDGAHGPASIQISLPDLGMTREAKVTVSECLPISVVVGHWDVEAGALNLTLEPEISFDQLLWATSLQGQEVPHTCGRKLSQDVLDELVSAWEEGRPPR
ncbi:MAG: hypothetical protein ACP5G2_04615 [Candidatus Bipolaricaulaceae bacterium]